MALYNYTIFRKKIEKIMKYMKWILVFLWMLLIFYFSHQNGIASTATSNFFVERVEILFCHVLPDMICNNVAIVVRKSAHFFLYLILGILVTNACSYQKKYWLLAILICILYACTDEIHQLFVVGRTGQIQDVAIDGAGSLLGVYFALFVKRIHKKIA